MKNNISKYFGLGGNQKDYDFIDIDLKKDNLLFIDPRLIAIYRKRLGNAMRNKLEVFTSDLLKNIRLNDGNGLTDITKGLVEPKETRLGYCKNNSRGNSMGKNKLKEDFIKSIKDNPVIFGGPKPRLSDFELFVDKINDDRISDLSTQIILSDLIKFTLAECNKHDITTKDALLNFVFDEKKSEWVQNYKCKLPYFNDSPIVFVPKQIVRKKGGANSALNSFVNYAIKEFILKDKKETENLTINEKVGRFTKIDWINYYFKSNNHNPNKDTITKWIKKYKNLLDSFALHYSANNKVNPLSDDEIMDIVY